MSAIYQTHEAWRDLRDQQDHEDSSDDVILFIEGDVYLETFDEQAEVVAEALDILLVTRDGISATGIPIGDDLSMRRLARMGYTVRIATAALQTRGTETAETEMKTEQTRKLTSLERYGDTGWAWTIETQTDGESTSKQYRTAASGHELWLWVEPEGLWYRQTRQFSLPSTHDEARAALTASLPTGRMAA